MADAACQSRIQNEIQTACRVEQVPVARAIAFYLPQFHPIPDNDLWWGKGFTEWTNVTKAKPLYKGHYQPRLPADLGYYDLRVPETRIAQAEMANNYGIEGFCYWHYWFAGKRLLERPFQEVLESGVPDFPFCLGWANDSWTGIWHGCPDRILIKQTYPGKEDYKEHFMTLLKAFGDDRYITVEGKPVFIVYKPHNLTEPVQFTDQWQNLAIRYGFKGLYFIGISDLWNWDPTRAGFDAWMIHNPGIVLQKLTKKFFANSIDLFCRRLTVLNFKTWIKPFPAKPQIFDYRNYMNYALPPLSNKSIQFPCVVPNWDNTPRCGNQGQVLAKSSPELFRQHFRHAVQQVIHRNHDLRLIFLKSWNEWAEGNFLEPDIKFGRSYLQAIRAELSTSTTDSLGN